MSLPTKARTTSHAGAPLVSDEHSLFYPNRRSNSFARPFFKVKVFATVGRRIETY